MMGDFPMRVALSVTGTLLEQRPCGVLFVNSKHHEVNKSRNCKLNYWRRILQNNVLYITPFSL